MKIERSISWFDKKSEELKGDLNIDDIDLLVLKNIFDLTEDDPLMYNPYSVSVKEADQLKDFIDIQFDFNKYTYQVDCFQI